METSRIIFLVWVAAAGLILGALLASVIYIRKRISSNKQDYDHWIKYEKEKIDCLLGNESPMQYVENQMKIFKAKDEPEHFKALQYLKKSINMGKQ